MVFFPSEEEKRFCDDQCERFGHGDGEPDAVDAEKFWQKKYRGDLNDERAQERNERAGCAIVEPREKRRTEDIETADIRIGTKNICGSAFKGREQLQSIRRKIKHGESEIYKNNKSLGLLNAYMRMQKYCNNTMEFYITSVLNKGTDIVIKIDIDKIEEEV